MYAGLGFFITEKTESQPVPITPNLGSFFLPNKRSRGGGGARMSWALCSALGWRRTIDLFICAAELHHSAIKECKMDWFHGAAMQGRSLYSIHRIVSQDLRVALLFQSLAADATNTADLSEELEDPSYSAKPLELEKGL